MRSRHTFTVRLRLPEALAPLGELAANLRWCWDRRTQQLFAGLDPGGWEADGRDPRRLLGRLGRARLEELAGDERFLSELAAVHGRLLAALEGDLWFQGRESPLRSAAYFSPEFGIAEALPQYSGGLGVLAGDHLKAASGLGVPLFGVGLFYRQGYFRQELAADGWQQERYVNLDADGLALTECEGVRVPVELGGEPVLARVWLARVGRIPLYLLDTDVEENSPDARTVNDLLYGGDTEHRLRQEILLGIGGVRALEAVGRTPQVFHTNEGHAGFLGLERMRRCILEEGLSLAEAVEAVRSGTTFTTHTPVPAGIDRFPRHLMERYFKGWAAECGVRFDDVMALGHEPGEPPDAPFNMAVMGLRLAAFSNGVSRLHGEVSRRIFSGLWPEVPPEEVPIGSVTNGVHAPSWASPEMSALLGRHVADEWWEAGPEWWAGLDEAADEELWEARNQARRRLVRLVRQRLRRSATATGLAEADVTWCDEALDPDALTIGFARRFAAYKRATLLLSQPDRLSALLLSADRPVQLLFAGKAHPADELGKQMIRQVVEFSHRPGLRHRIVFVEDYDIGVARTLIQGSDLWLNTPRRPLEACGTSGQKAVLSGALNCSILDGWWAECYDGTNGWAIASAESYPDLGRRDEAEAASLFGLLERQIVPAFYRRSDGGVPRDWLARVRSSLRTLGPFVVASRMVRDYVTDMYEPAAARADAMSSEGHARARALAAWKQRVHAGWPQVKVESVGESPAAPALGDARRVTAVLALGDLAPSDVEVHLAHGPVGAGGELADPAVVGMVSADSRDGGRHRYEATFPCDQAGSYGFTIRVVPAHPDLLTFAELGAVTWG